MEIELGKKYKDIVTGFEGVATGVTQWITGCDTVILNPGVDKDGKERETAQFDVTRLKETKAKKIEPENKIERAPRKKGGPQQKVPSQF